MVVQSNQSHFFGHHIIPQLFFWKDSKEPSINNITQEDLKRIVFKGTINDSLFITTISGYIAINEEEGHIANNKLNSFLLASTLLCGNSLDSIGENEMDTCRLSLNSNEITISFTTIDRLSSFLANYPDSHMFFINEIREINPPFYDVRMLEPIIELASEINSSEFNLPIIQFFHGHTMMQKMRPISAFINFWMSAEIVITSEIQEFLISKGVPMNDINQMKKWSIPRKIKFIKNHDIFQPTSSDDLTTPTEVDLEEIKKLANIRNKIIHECIRPTPIEINDIFQIANKVLWRFFRLSSINYNSLLKKSDKIQSEFQKKYY